MRKKLQKAFTLVELIVVIAIIAILAAVSVVSYIAFVNEANKSADQQAVTQMNTILEANEKLDGKPETITQVFGVLENNGISAEDYHPLLSNRYFFWDSSVNRIVYSDDAYSVLYPSNLTSQTKASGWYTLSGEIKSDSAWQSAPTTVRDSNGNITAAAIGTPEQMFDVFTKLNKKEISLVSTSVITLTEDLDMMGTGQSFNLFSGTLDGGNHTISSLALTKSTQSHFNEAYGTNKAYVQGLIGQPTSDIVVKNLKIDNFQLDVKANQVAALIGNVVFKATSPVVNSVSIQNVDITNSTIKGGGKVGSFIGQVQGTGTVTIDANSTIRNSTVTTTVTESGGVIGLVSSSATVNIADSTIIDDSVTVKYDFSNASTFATGEDELATFDLKDVIFDATEKTPILKYKGTALYTGTFNVWHYSNATTHEDYVYLIIAKYYIKQGTFGSLKFPTGIIPNAQSGGAWLAYGEFAVNDLTKTAQSNYYSQVVE